MTPYSEAMTTKFLAPITFLGLAAALGPVHAEEGNWEPSTLSQATQDRVHAALSAYQRCVDGETRAHLNDRADSRRVTEAILRACEDPLTAIKTAFDAEHVPAALGTVPTQQALLGGAADPAPGHGQPGGPGRRPATLMPRTRS